MPEVHDLGLIIDSHIPLIIIQSHEETRSIDTLSRLARKRSLPIYSWTITDGLKRRGFGLELEEKDKLDEPDDILKHIKRSSTPGIYVLCDFHPWLDDAPRRVRLLKDIALNHRRTAHTVVLISHQLNTPPELKHLSAQFTMHLPSPEQIMTIVRDEAGKWSTSNQNKRVKTDNKTLQQLVKNLQGVSYSEARRLARGAIIDDGAITSDDIPTVNKAKFDLMDMDGVLSFEYDTAKFSDVGGLDNLKRWLTERKSAFHETGEHALQAPKGIMLLGVQGGGKSLAAKAVSGVWGVPLLRLDFGSLYNKFFGETERNLREALKLAELMSPCVLWIDEIEKGLGQDSNDQGISKRILGTLLTWMAENTHPVFIVATANNVSALPPELIRKGRIDEVFFVDLPNKNVRQEIFEIHLAKRALDCKQFNTRSLATLSEGFSGAEIEQAIVSARYAAQAQETEMNETHILNEITSTQPLSVLMSEKLDELRVWASERTVKA